MFFHTKRELDVAEIFGVTDKFGLRLINQKHPFPYFVEQEERYHGALISHTSYGGVYRIFESLDYNDASPNMEDPMIPGLVRDNTKKTFNLCRAIRRKIYDNSVDVQESFSKYISFSKQVLELKTWPESLKKMLESEQERYTSLKKLIDILGLPDATDAGNNQFQMNVAYMAAKWILTTEELSLLYGKDDILAFGDWLKNDFFLLNNTIDTRTNDVFIFLKDYLPQLKAIYRSNSNPAPDVLYGDSNSKAVYDLMGTQLKLKGHDHLALQNPFEISLMLLVVVAKIKIVSEHIHTILKDDYVEILATGTKISGRIIESPNLYASILSSDLALRVRYDQLYNEESKWHAVSRPEEILMYFAGGAINNLFVYPRINDAGEAECFLNVQSKLGKDKDNNQHLYIRNYFFEKSTLKEILGFVSKLKSISTAIVLLPNNVDGLTEYSNAARVLAPYGNLVVWTHNSDLFNLYLLKGKHFLLGTETFLYKFVQKMRHPADHPYMHVTLDDNFCFFSSSPNYYAIALWRISAQNADNPYLSDFGSRVVMELPDSKGYVYFNQGKLDLTNAQTKCLNAAVNAYKIIYEHPTLPGYLPLYDPVKMWQQLKTLK